MKEMNHWIVFLGIIDNQPIINNFKNPEEIPTKTQLLNKFLKH